MAVRFAEQPILPAVRVQDRRFGTSDNSHHDPSEEGETKKSGSPRNELADHGLQLSVLQVFNETLYAHSRLSDAVKLHLGVSNQGLVKLG